MTRISRRELRQNLAAHATEPAAVPDASFVDGLERRLLNLDTSASAGEATVLQLGRHIHRGVAIGVFAATLTGAMAAAAIVGTAHETRPIVTAPSSTQPVSAATTTSTGTPTTSSPAAATIAPRAPTSVSTPTTQVPSVPTTAVVAPPPTLPVAPEPTTTTEVRLPATIALTCTPDGGTVRCNWTAGPDGTATYVLLRSRPSGVDRRVLNPGSATTYADGGLSSGSTYAYLVHALNASGTSIAHSELVLVTIP